MAISITLHKRGFAGLDKLIAIGPKKLAALAEFVSKMTPTLEIEWLIEELARQVEIAEEHLHQALFDAIIPFNGLRVELDVDPEDFLDDLLPLIKRQNLEWHDANQAKLMELEPSLVGLISPNGFFAKMQKLFQLLSNRQCIAQEFKILTELRPLYDEEVTVTEALLLTSTFVISYNENGEAKRIHLAIDREDLQNLQEQIDRAEKKAHLLEEQAGLLGVPVLIAGSDRE